jgi:hypothetical protein
LVRPAEHAVSTPRRNSRPPMLQGLKDTSPADHPSNQILDHSVQNHPKISQLAVIRRVIGIGSNAFESFYRSYAVATYDVNLLASQICHNRLFRKILQQNLLQMISTELSSSATHNTRHLLSIRAYAVSQASSMSASSKVAPPFTFLDLCKSSSVDCMLSENKFMLIVRRLRSYLTSLCFGRL